MRALVILALLALSMGAGAQTVLLDEDFEAGSLAGWSVVDHTGYADWQIVTGALSEINGASNGVYAPPYLGNLPGTYIVYDAGATWTDYTVTFALHPSDDDTVGLLFRYQDDDNYYRFDWNLQIGFRRIVKKVAGVYTILDEANYTPYSPPDTYAIEISAVGDQLEVKVDDVVIYTVTDSDLTQGSIAPYSWGANSLTFDNIFVQSPTPPRMFYSDAPDLVGKQPLEGATLEPRPYYFSLEPGTRWEGLVIDQCRWYCCLDVGGGTDPHGPHTGWLAYDTPVQWDLTGMGNSNLRELYQDCTFPGEPIENLYTNFTVVPSGPPQGVPYDPQALQIFVTQ